MDGYYGREPHPCRSFWADNKVKNIMTMEAEELDILIKKHLDEYQERQLKLNPNWHWPPISEKAMFKSIKEYYKTLDKGSE